MSIDPREFRAALGSFPTGVTIVTTAEENGQPVGVTASSFNSVSLDPPLVLWSLAKSSKSNDVFCSSGHFAIHVLSAEQEDLSNRFARSGEDKFSNVDWQPGQLGSPVLGNYAALFECKTLHQYEGGDHVILVGEVVSFMRKDAAPLVFHGGRYAETRSRGSGGEGETVDIEHGVFTDEFLFYLLARAHFQASFPARRKIEEMGLNQRKFMTLAVLSMESPLSLEEISARLDHTGLTPSDSDISDLVEAGLLAQSGGSYELSAAGRDAHITVLSVAKAFEDDLLAQLTPGEVHEAKRLMRKIIELTGEGIPLGWRKDGNED